MKGKKELLYGHIPSCPGVYLMKNENDTIVYIGKSNNLKARVRSYFMDKASLNFAKKKMVQLIRKIDYIETLTDIEALMLETNLIKQHHPKYNVLMKDGKNLSYIKITDDEIPCLTKTRFKNTPLIRGGRGGWEYFGPYSQYFDVWRYIRFIRKIFRLGNHDRLDKFGPACMDAYLDMCPGHCTGDPDKIALYKIRLREAREFLLWNQDKVIEEIRQKMLIAAQERRYEDAAEYKSNIEQIETTGNKQIVRDAIDGDALVVVGLEKYEHIFLAFVEIKNGMIIGVHEYKLENPLEEPAQTLYTQALIQHLVEYPQECIYSDIPFTEDEIFQHFIASNKVKLKHPARGEKVRILEFAHTNLLNFAFRETMENFKKSTLSKATMANLMKTLGFTADDYEKKKEIVFECFDISHSHGEHTVASKSVLINGKPDPKRYRKYRIKSLKTGKIDDFASMEEILARRALGAIRGEDPWPDLIVIDGGKWQLSHAVEAIEKSIKAPLSRGVAESRGVSDSNTKPPFDSPLDRGACKVPFIISLAKRIEEVFLPEQSDPILLEKWSPELMLLQKIRDEAHRFAINFNRASRDKWYTKTVFDELPGIGPVARKKILSHISRVEELSKWDFKKAEKLFGRKTAEILQDHGLIES